MSFHDVGIGSLAYTCNFTTGEAKARKVMASSMVRLDESWESLRRTTLSVACVTVAAAKEEGLLTEELLNGMVAMMGRMCEFWSEAVGGITGSPPNLVDMRQESDAVDLLGLRLAEKADPLLGAVMTRLLAELPKVWSLHFRLAAESIRTIGVMLEGDDSSWASRLVIDEQHQLSAKFVRDVQLAFDGDSQQMAAASDWVEAARVIFEAAMLKGVDPGNSLAAAVGTLGFPNAEE